MDKETLIRLATPASITLLALSIFSIPLLSNADVGASYRGERNNYPIYVQLVDGHTN